MIKWINSHKNFTITLIITLLLFIILSIITYIIYVYGYYDKIKENEILENFNSYKFDRVHKDLYLSDKEHLTTKNLKSITDIMFNKKNLEKIYNSYYKDTNKYSNKEDFINRYYYGISPLSIKDIKFKNTGKTTILSRRLSKSKSYKLRNIYKDTTQIGIINNITFTTIGNDVLKIDEDIITCSSSCTIAKMYSGIHNIEYSHDGFTYYSILLIDKDNSNIDVNNLKNLVTISKEIDLSVFDDMAEYDVELNYGIYSLNKCNLSAGCPSTNYSYITLNKDNTCAYYTYLSVDKAGDSYFGTYKKENGFLLLDFTTHSYSIFNNNTNKNEDISISSNIKMTFKIDNKSSFSNKDYIFSLKA